MKETKALFIISLLLTITACILFCFLRGETTPTIIASFLLAIVVALVLALMGDGEKKGGIIVYLIGIACFTVYLATTAIPMMGNPEKQLFHRAVVANNESAYQEYLNKYPHGEYEGAALDSIQARRFDEVKNLIDKSKLYEFIAECPRPAIKQRACRQLDVIYRRLENGQQQPDSKFVDAYINNYPTGPYYQAILKKADEIKEQEAYEAAVDGGTVKAYDAYLKKYPRGKHASEIKSLKQRYVNEHKYDGNYLRTGSQPYANVYGNNSSYGNCTITVNASGSTDVVVIVKRNNRYGKVAGHAYIHKGGSYTIHLQPGTYQTFFYYGTSWNPTKKLKNGLTGGFMYDEQYGQDNSLELKVSYVGDYIYYDTMTYSLQSVIGGNFRMADSSESAVF